MKQAQRLQALFLATLGVAIGLTANLIIAQEVGPTPRLQTPSKVQQPPPQPRALDGDPVPDRHLQNGGWLLEVHVFVGATFEAGEWKGDGEFHLFGAGTGLGMPDGRPNEELRYFLRMLGAYYASEKRSVRVRFWDYTHQEWHDILDRKRAEGWDGFFDLRTVVKVGSADL